MYSIGKVGWIRHANKTVQRIATLRKDLQHIKIQRWVTLTIAYIQENQLNMFIDTQNTPPH